MVFTALTTTYEMEIFRQCQYHMSGGFKGIARLGKRPHVS
jgi:hypothetical protein